MSRDGGFIESGRESETKDIRPEVEIYIKQWSKTWRIDPYILDDATMILDNLRDRILYERGETATEPAVISVEFADYRTAHALYGPVEIEYLMSLSDTGLVEQYNDIMGEFIKIAQSILYAKDLEQLRGFKERLNQLIASNVK